MLIPIIDRGSDTKPLERLIAKVLKSLLGVRFLPKQVMRRALNDPEYIRGLTRRRNRPK